MTRVAENQILSRLLWAMQNNRRNADTLSDQISSGIAVRNPSDSPQSGEISRYQQTLDRMESFNNRIASVKSFLEFQDDTINEATNILNRAREIAEQAGNSTNSETTRAQMAEEVWQIRDHLVSLANSTYQGKYVWGGADDDDAPFDPLTYTNPATGNASRRYVFDDEAGTDVFRSVQVSDDISLTVNTDGQALFTDAIAGLERLGRALSGYRTTLTSGLPDGGGTAYTFPTDFEAQTTDIRAAMDVIESSRKDDLLVERVNLGGKMRRLDTAVSLMNVTKTSSQEALSTLQDTDATEAASKLAQAQSSLQATMVVTGRVLNMTILDYL